MSETQPARSIGRSIGALLAGFVVVVILSLGTDLALQRLASSRRWARLCPTRFSCWRRPIVRFTPSWAATSRRGLRPIGPWSTRCRRCIGLSWRRGRGGDVEQGSRAALVSLALIVTALPCAWVGGKLRLMQLRAGRLSRIRLSCFRRSARGGRGAGARRGRGPCAPDRVPCGSCLRWNRGARRAPLPVR